MSTEQRLLLAVVLSFAVVAAYQAWYGPALQPPTDGPDRVTEGEGPPEGEGPLEGEGPDGPTDGEGEPSDGPGVVPDEEEPPDEEGPDGEDVPGDEDGEPAEGEPPDPTPEEDPRHELADDIPGPSTAVFDRIRYTNQGGGIRRITYADYRNPEMTGPHPALRIEHGDPPVPGLFITDATGQTDLVRRRWAHRETEEGGVVFTTRVGSIVIEKEIAPSGDRHLVDVEVRVRNESPDAYREFPYYVFGAAGIPKEGNARGTGVYAILGKKEAGAVSTEYIWASDVTGEELAPMARDVDEAWAGLSSKYFAAMLWPRGETDAERMEVWPLTDPALYVDDDRTDRAGRLEEFTEGQAVAGFLMEANLGPGQEVSHTFGLYLGPKDDDTIAGLIEADPDAESLGLIVDLGWPSWLSRLFLKLLHLFYSVIPIYGVDIILMTLLVRGGLHPISSRGQRSMYKMQQIKPQLDEIREKYSKDPQEMQKEMMKAYREHGVNPVGGCAPLFLQIPVFLGLYNCLLYAIELRQASFLWIADLSRPDRLFELGFTVPVVGWEYFNLLPILMIVLMISQHQLQPQPSDPEAQAQRKVMQFVFVFMGFIFYTIPAGLVLYFVFSSFIGMLEQRWVKASLEPAE